MSLIFSLHQTSAALSQRKVSSLSKLINGLIQLHLHLNRKKRLFDSWLTHLKKQAAVLIIFRPVHRSALLLHQVDGLNNV